MSRFISTTSSLILTAVLALIPFAAWTQAYPSKAVRLVVPFPPGGSADAAARPLAEKMGALIGQSFVVDNKAGGLTVIGADIVAKAPSDGYTLFIMPGTHVLSPMLVKSVPFHPIRDFTTIGMIATIPYVIFSDSRQPFTNMKELIAYARANPGKLSIGTTDSPSRLVVESLNASAKIQLNNINYKGAAQLATDVVGGHTHLGVLTPPSLLAFYKEKRIQALGITGNNRLTAMPAVPTVAEAAGIHDHNFQTWFALAGPANLPKTVVIQLQQLLQKVVSEADMRERLVNQGMEPANDAGTETATAYILSEHNRLGKMILAAGIKPE